MQYDWALHEPSRGSAEVVSDREMSNSGGRSETQYTRSMIATHALWQIQNTRGQQDGQRTSAPEEIHGRRFGVDVQSDDFFKRFILWPFLFLLFLLFNKYDTLCGCLHGTTGSDVDLFNMTLRLSLET